MSIEIASAVMVEAHREDKRNKPRKTAVETIKDIVKSGRKLLNKSQSTHQIKKGKVVRGVGEVGISSDSEHIASTRTADAYLSNLPKLTKKEDPPSKIVHEPSSSTLNLTPQATMHSSFPGDDQWEDLLSEPEKVWEKVERKAKGLIRKRDFLHLVLSYPMKPEADDDISFLSLSSWSSLLIQRIRQVQALLSDNSDGKHINEMRDVIKEVIEVIHIVERRLAGYDFHLLAYLPCEEEEAHVWSDESLTQRIEVGLMGQSSCRFDIPYDMWRVASDSAVRQVCKCIDDGIIRKIGISGMRAHEVTMDLRYSRVTEADCSVVLSVSVSRYDSPTKIRDEIAEQISSFQQADVNYIFPNTLPLAQSLPYNFLLIVNWFDDDAQIDLRDLEIPDHGFVVLSTETKTKRVQDIMEVDLEIRTEDLLLPWELFCRNVGRSLVDSSSVIREMAANLVENCEGHLLAITLLSRALKGVADSSVWELSLKELTSYPDFSRGRVEEKNRVMFNVLKIILDGKDNITKQCIKYCTRTLKLDKDLLVSNWISNGLVGTEAEGIAILEDLINSYLLEKVGKDHIRMREETKIVLEKYFLPYPPCLHPRRGGLVFNESPTIEQWIIATEIHLTDGKLPKLPENPKCPSLNILLLNKNDDLMQIPELFFADMPRLQTLDLSFTSIKSLPPSISKLSLLRTFNLRGCGLLMELPPQIGELGNLEEFDLDGTELMYLPEEIGALTRLRFFKFSFCGQANGYGKTKRIGNTVPTKALSIFSRLEKLCIDVKPVDESEWWDTGVKAILKELSDSKELKSLELYLSSVDLMQLLKWTSTEPMYPNLDQFKFIVGHHPQRIISRLPREVEKKIEEEWETSRKCVKFINGEGIPTELIEVLSHTLVFLLDRHWTVTTLSEFGNENMIELKFCLLMECNELETIIDVDFESRPGGAENPVFGQLQYLGIHYMKSLQSLWRGPIEEGCLNNLRHLSLHTCPNLTIIFTPEILGNLEKLEELIVEDCPKVSSLLSQKSSTFRSDHFLGMLSKISLLYLPELVSLFGGLSIGGRHKTLTVYNCPKLENLGSWGGSLKIKGEKEWFEALQPTFEELGSDGD